MLSNAQAVSEPVKKALAEIVRRKQRIEQTVAQRQQLEQRIREIGEDQSRIRQNMAQLDHDTDVYRNYVKKLSNQETQVEQFRAEIAKLSADEMSQRKSLDDFLTGLDL
jgi:chaperonin cofactor prefoldin